jgi:hypothetical protein
MSEKARLRAQVTVSLANLGIVTSDIVTLGAIARGLHRWDELECGDEHGNCIERDEETGVPFMTSEPWDHSGPRLRRQIPDKERQLKERLRRVMERYPALVAYHQGDCRGWPLYILRRDDLRLGERVDAVYNRGAGVPGHV